jgi:hypothetical protein
VLWGARGARSLHAPASELIDVLTARGFVPNSIPSTWLSIGPR